jgi:hypothetical protein
MYGNRAGRDVIYAPSTRRSYEPLPQWKEGHVPEPSAIDGVLRAIVEAMEAREAAEPDLPEWEANARLRAAEASLLRLYRESGHPTPNMVAIDIEVSSQPNGHYFVEVA